MDADYYCLLPVGSGCPCPVVEPDGVVLTFDGSVALRSNTVSDGSDDKLRLLSTHRPASATQPASSIAGSVTTNAPRKLAKAVSTRNPATQSCLAAMNKA